eukprot:1001658-Lingulodinium_polyedra.AAC.1
MGGCMRRQSTQLPTTYHSSAGPTSHRSTPCGVGREGGWPGRPGSSSSTRTRRCPLTPRPCGGQGVVAETVALGHRP